MKNVITLLLSLFCLTNGLAAPAPAPEHVRTIKDIPGLPLAVLQRTLSPAIYRHVAVSPVQAWVMVRGQLSGTRLYGINILHSEENGAYDKYALQLARDWRITGHFGLGKLTTTTPVVLNVLVYEIADGTMALSFPVFEEAGGSQLEYYGAAKLAVQQPDGDWKDLVLPQGPLQGVWAVRAGLANNWELTSLLDKCIGDNP